MTDTRIFLLTGATTALGRCLAKQLQPLGRVIGVRAPDEPQADTTDPVTCTADLTRSTDVRRVVIGLATEANVDTVVHLGSSGRHDRGRSGAASTRVLLDAAERTGCVRGFVLRSTCAIYRSHHDDAVVMNEQHPLDFSPELSAQQRDWLEADLSTGQRVAGSRLAVAVLRLPEILAPDVRGVLADYVRLDPCYRAMGFDPMLNVISLEDAAQALALAAQRGPRGIFNVVGADSLPVSELLHRAGGRCWPVPDALIEPLCALRGVEPSRYAALRALLHHGAVIDGRAARGAFGYTPLHPVAFERLRKQSTDRPSR